MAEEKVMGLIAQLQEASTLGLDNVDVNLDEFTTEELVAAAKAADDAYENGDDELYTDAVYNFLRERIRIAIPADAFNEVVGSDVRGGKIALPYGMGSLTQAYTTADFLNWFLKHGLKPRSIFCATAKLDGMSCSLHFGDTGLRIAYSRGNGFEGADMTRHVKHLKSVPKNVPAGTEVRAELIISKKNFEFLKTRVFRKGGQPYKNPRNMVSGLMNSSEVTDPMVYNYIDCIVYHDWNELVVAKSVQLTAFKKMGFLIPEWETLTSEQLTDEYLTALLTKLKEESEYELDGVVIEADEPELRAKMNPSKATLNPEYARKYKVQDAANNAVATVHYVELRVSKRGYVKPRVHYIPFSLPGITCTHSTGYNMKFIIDNGICPGAKVNMYRAGDVIPNILSSHTPGSFTLEDFEEQLSEIGEWEWVVNDKGEKIDVRLTGDHANIGLKLAEAFFTAIGVDGLKLGNLQKMFDVGFDTPEKIIKATPDEWAFALASNSTADKIYPSLHKALKSCTEPQFMGATGLFGRGVGKRKVGALYTALGDIITTFTLNDVHNITLVEGFSFKTAMKFLNGLPQYLDFYSSVIDYVEFVTPKVVEGGKLNGMKFVFTGFRSKELADKIAAAGGEVLDSFSTKANMVIAADPHENSGKMAKARKAGIDIKALADVNDIF